MKYLPVDGFESVARALNFNTPDCNVTGGCDLYTTKSTGSDKKLLKTIDRDLSSQHDALLKLGASLSPPGRRAAAVTSPSLQMATHSSAFGPLSELSSRRIFAYLIATLNASHPHYDFSHVLRPADFRRERNLRRVMANLDSILQNVRPGGGGAPSPDDFFDPADPERAAVVTGSPWGPGCWSLIDKEMRLADCTVFRYAPDADPFEEEEGAIWAAHYFFFSRALKRVAYLYVRVVPVVSSASPPLRAPGLHHHRYARPSGGVASASGLGRVGSGSGSGLGSGAGASASTNGNGKRPRGDEDEGAKKRARYWLSERDAALVEAYGADDDDDEQDDGFFWNRGEDGDLVQFADDQEAGFDEDDAGYDEEDSEGSEADDDDVDSDERDEEEEEEKGGIRKNPVREMSEDIPGRLEL